MNKGSSQKSSLILITSHFPFGSGESFLETEIQYLASSFDKIHIVARDIRSPKTRDLPENVTFSRYNPSSSFSDILFLPFLLIKNTRIALESFMSEVQYRKTNQKKLDFTKLILLAKAITKAIQLKCFLEETIRINKLTKDLVLYSYWTNSGAHAISMLKSDQVIKITRAHRVDLYEEENKKNFLPLQYFACTRMDRVFLISEHGSNYLKTHLKLSGNNFLVSRLGVSYDNFISQYRKQERFTVVSCSSLTKIKRVHLIIRALSAINPVIPITWIHFGGGILLEELQKLATSTFGSGENVVWRFAGPVPNSTVLDFYNKNNVDLFINTSSSEGIPVSIMEAQVFGIPVIATDCGGTGELVTSATGRLVPVNSSPEELARIIEMYYYMNETEYISLRRRIKDFQERYFNASINYNDFIASIMEMINLKKLNNK